MKVLTEYQKEFFLKHFFENEKYPGWKGIATTLLEEGQCIVAGTEPIWRGGIGNFIKTEIEKNAFDCLLYKFDLEYFLTSEWYKQISNDYIAILSNKKRSIDQEYEEICKI